MTQHIRQVVLFSFLAFASYGIYKYYFDPLEIEQNKPFTKGYSVENIELKITNDVGKLSAKFQSPSIIRYTNDPTILIANPLFWTYKNGIEHWLLSAQKGTFNSDSRVVFMDQNVEAKTINELSKMAFKANDLIIDLSSNMAKTENGISLNKTQFSMSGSVAQFDLENEILSVKDNIKAVYKPIVKKN